MRRAWMMVLAAAVWLFGGAAGGVMAQTAADADTAVAAAVEAHQASPSGGTLAGLSAALDAYEGPPTTATVNGHILHVSGLARDARSRSDYSGLEEAAGAAAAHLEPVRGQLPGEWADMALLAAVGEFRSERSRNAVLAMARIESFLEAVAHEASLLGDDDLEAALRGRTYNALAWRSASSAWFESSRHEDGPSDRAVRRALDTYPLPRLSGGADDDDEDSAGGAGAKLPFCEGELDFRRKPVFPGSALNKGEVGAVVIGFDFVDGKAENVRALASVPESGFADAAVKGFSTVRWRPDPGERPGETCRMNRENVVNPVLFAIG